MPPTLFSSFSDFGEGVPQSSAPGPESVDRLQPVLLTLGAPLKDGTEFQGPQPCAHFPSFVDSLTLAWLV